MCREFTYHIFTILKGRVRRQHVLLICSVLPLITTVAQSDTLSKIVFIFYPRL